MKKIPRTGATTVELALVLPMIFTIVLGLVEWGRYEMIRQVTSTAAFNAARLGAVAGSTTGDVEAKVDSILAVYFVGGATTTSTLTPTESTVSIEVPVGPNSFFLRRFYGESTLSREFTIDAL